ncbi:uncharacterized protein ACO6RY_01104 [Pungitius sinensis]
MDSTSMSEESLQAVQLPIGFLQPMRNVNKAGPHRCKETHIALCTGANDGGRGKGPRRHMRAEGTSFFFLSTSSLYPPPLPQTLQQAAQHSNV